jgi:hypothetical protein
VVHEVMIKRIIAAAQSGERDVRRLRDVGLSGLRKPTTTSMKTNSTDGKGLNRSGLNRPKFRTTVLPKRQLRPLSTRYDRWCP